MGREWVKPGEFWALTPGEVWWLIDARMPKPKAGEDVDDMYQALKEAQAEENALAGE